MLFQVPSGVDEHRRLVARLDDLRAQLYDEVTVSSPWLGKLRREVQAGTVESSISIEGFEVTHSDALAIVSGSEELPLNDQNRSAASCYSKAMDRVGTLARDPSFRWLDRVILDLHFDVCHFQRDAAPGRWRTGPTAVTSPDGTLAYVGPPAEDVAGLMSEVVGWLQSDAQELPPVVRAAIAHLHLVSIHPFQDGNGRTARVIQSLVLAREGMLSPQFGSIEDYLARNTPAYYAALEEAQGGSYQPERDATAWVTFCLTAHIEQAERRLRQVEEAAFRWDRLERHVHGRGWPERLVIALEHALTGGVERGPYSVEAEIAAPTASGDLRRLLDAGLVSRSRAGGRSTSYVATDELRALVQEESEHSS